MNLIINLYNFRAYFRFIVNTTHVCTLQSPRESPIYTVYVIFTNMYSTTLYMSLLDFRECAH